MKKKIRNIMLSVLMILGILISSPSPVFAGQAPNSFYFNIKNRTSISATVKVTFKLYQDYVTTTPYRTETKTYTIGAGNTQKCWPSITQLSGGKTAWEASVTTSGVKISKSSGSTWTETVYLDMSGIDVTFRNVGSGIVNFTVKTNAYPSGKTYDLTPGGATVISMPYNSYYNISSYYSKTSGLEAYISQGSQSLYNITSSKEVRFSTRAKAKTYTVVFNGNDNTGGSMSNQTFTVGVAQNLRANSFSKTGHYFAGWATSSGGSVVYSDGQSVKDLSTTNGAMVNLYAKWNVNTYTVKYNANGGTGAPGNQTKTYGKTLTLSSTKPTRSNGSSTRYVTFDGNGGSTGATNNKIGFTVSTAYTFSKWNTAANGSGTSYNPGGSYTSNSSVTLYAQYNGTDTVASVKLPTPSRTGYSFDGWYTAKTGGTKRGAAGDTYTPPAAGETLYAHWTPIAYRINYNLEGGTNHRDNPSTYTIEQTVTLKDPSRNGYRFIKWTPSSSIAKGSTGEKTFTATWEPITRNITVKKDDKSYNDTVKILVDGTTYTVNVPAGTESKSVAVPIGHEVKVVDATTTSDKELRVEPLTIPAGNADAVITVTHISKDITSPKVVNYKLSPDAFTNTTYYPTATAVTYSPANTDSNIELDARFFTNGTVTVTAHITDDQSGIKEINLLNRSNTKIRTIKTFTSNFLEQTLSADVSFTISSRLLITDGYKIQVIDGAGNRANYMLIVPQIDKVKPAIQSVTTDSGSITIKVSDDYSGVASWQYRVKFASTGYDTGWKNGAADSRIARIPIVNSATVNATGTYSALLSVKITDRAGNVFVSTSDMVIELGKHYLSNGDLIDYDYIFAKYDAMFGKGAAVNAARANRFYNFLLSDTANASKATKRFTDQKIEEGMSKAEALQYFFDIFNYRQH